MIRDRTLVLGLTVLLCVDVRIGDVRYLDCLNEMFRAAVQPAGTAGPASNPAAIPAPAAGTYNQAALREMLGQSFGHSVFPARPAPVIIPRGSR